MNTVSPVTPEALRVEGEMTVFCAQEQATLLLAEPAPATLDLAAVTEIDTAGVQLLLLAQRRGTRLLQASAAVCEVLALLHLAAPPQAVVDATPPMEKAVS